MNSQFIIIVCRWNKVIYIMTGEEYRAAEASVEEGRKELAVTAAGNWR